MLNMKPKSKNYTVGSWITLDNIAVAEVMSKSGFDWLCIDLEHTTIDYKELQNLIAIISYNDLEVFVRVGKNDELIIKRVLDAGANGIVVPLVKNAEEAKKAIKYSLYPPIGERGVNSLSRAQGYGFDFKKYLEKVNKKTKVIVQIEHIDAINELENILKVFKPDVVQFPLNIFFQSFDETYLKKLKKLNVDYVFIPKTNEVYKVKRTKKLIINTKKNILCGKFRKGHFEGVIDIIERFLNLINPNYMFLGEKDFQQLFLIKKYIKNKFKAKIIPCKTIRDKNFVALSSRNFLLSKKNLLVASKIAKKLKSIKNKIKKNNFQSELLKNKKYLIKNYKIKIEYLELRNEKDLSIYKKGKKFRMFIAYYINKVRLIDNF